MDFSGIYINYHHISLLCDRMTCNKNMVPIFRSGLLNDNVGPIKKEKKYSYENIIKNIETEMNIIFRNKIIGEPKLKITTMSFCNQSSKLIDRLVNIHQICMNNVKNHFLYHYSIFQNQWKKRWYNT